MLEFLEKLTLLPHQVGPEEIHPLRQAGISDEEIADAVHVCAIFHVINRTADALGYELYTQEEFAWVASMMLRMGYRLPG